MLESICLLSLSLTQSMPSAPKEGNPKEGTPLLGPHSEVVCKQKHMLRTCKLQVHMRLSLLSAEAFISNIRFQLSASTPLLVTSYACSALRIRITPTSLRAVQMDFCREGVKILANWFGAVE